MTWGLKLGTQPHGAVEDPSPVAVGDVRWYRGASWRNATGRLYRRKVVGGEKVRVARVLPGHVSVEYVS